MLHRWESYLLSLHTVSRHDTVLFVVWREFYKCCQQVEATIVTRIFSPGQFQPKKGDYVKKYCEGYIVFFILVQGHFFSLLEREGERSIDSREKRQLVAFLMQPSWGRRGVGRESTGVFL